MLRMRACVRRDRCPSLVRDNDRIFRLCIKLSVVLLTCGKRSLNQTKSGPISRADADSSTLATRRHRDHSGRYVPYVIGPSLRWERRIKVQLPGKENVEFLSSMMAVA
jgi:hypothetical protein